MLRTIKLLSILIAVAIGIPSKLMAQQQMQIDIESAIQHALEHNKNLVNAGLRVDEANERLREVITQGLPQVNATVDYSNFFGSTATLGEPPMAFEIEFTPTSNISASVGQLVFSGSYIVGIQTAKLYKELIKTSLEKTELDIKAQVTQAYILCLVSMESMKIVEKNIENMRDLLTKTKSLVQVGVAEEVDYDQLSVQVNMLENGLRATERQVELSLNMLRLQMGLDVNTQLVLTDELNSLVNLSDYQNSLTQPFALNDNIDFQLVQFQTTMAEKQIKMERAAYLPTISGFYNYTEKLIKPEFDMTPNHVIGLNVNIPIFSSGSRRSRVNQARINYQIAENEQELISEQLLIQEKQLRYNLRTALEQFESQKANVVVAKRVYNSLNNKYQQGVISSLDLTTANNNYLQAENSYISALLQLMEAQIAMDKLLNQL